MPLPFRRRRRRYMQRYYADAAIRSSRHYVTVTPQIFDAASAHTCYLHYVDYAISPAAAAHAVAAATVTPC